MECDAVLSGKRVHKCRRMLLPSLSRQSNNGLIHLTWNNTIVRNVVKLLPDNTALRPNDSLYTKEGTCQYSRHFRTLFLTACSNGVLSMPRKITSWVLPRGLRSEPACETQVYVEEYYEIRSCRTRKKICLRHAPNQVCDHGVTFQKAVRILISYRKLK